MVLTIQQVIIKIPHVFLQTPVYGLIVYNLIGLDCAFVKFLWYMFFTFLYFTFYGVMAVAMTPSSGIAAIVATTFYVVWNIFAGFLVP
jgi:ABC-type multidrug transport system permease subunit